MNNFKLMVFSQKVVRLGQPAITMQGAKATAPAA